MIFPSVIVKTIGPKFQNSELFLHSKENKNGSLLLDTLYCSLTKAASSATYS